MTSRIVMVVSCLAVIAEAIASAGWLLWTGNAAQFHGLLLAKAGILAGVILALRLLVDSNPWPQGLLKEHTRASL